MPRARKRGRSGLLNELAGVRASQGALSSLAKTFANFADSQGDGLTRWALGEHLKLQIEPIKHIIALEPREEGEELQWTLLHPAKLVQQLVDESPALAEAFGKAANRSAPSQERLWRIVLGFDEFALGNMLKYNNARKTMVSSFTFIELELCHFDDAWFAIWRNCFSPCCCLGQKAWLPPASRCCSLESTCSFSPSADS